MDTPNKEGDWEKEFDCFEYGCGECEICKYLNFLEWAESVGKPEGSVIQRNERLERYLKLKKESLASHEAKVKESVILKIKDDIEDAIKETKTIDDMNARLTMIIVAILSSNNLSAHSPQEE